MTSTKPAAETPDWRAFYESEAASGDRIVAGGYVNRGVPVTERQLDLVGEDIAGKLGLSKQHSLLDVGCGAGLLLDRLAPRVKLAVGADLSVTSLKLCPPGRYSLAAADATRLPFADGSFDRVLCYSMVMCLPELALAERLMTDLVRVLKPGGLLLVGDVQDHDLREQYWNYSSGTRLPKLWPLRRTFRRLRDSMGVEDAAFGRIWAHEYRSFSMYPASWFRGWAKRRGLGCEILRWRRPEAGRGTDPTRYDVRIVKPDGASRA